MPPDIPPQAPVPDLTEIEVEPLTLSSGLCDTPEDQEEFDRELAAQAPAAD